MNFITMVLAAFSGRMGNQGSQAPHGFFCMPRGRTSLRVGGVVPRADEDEAGHIYVRTTKGGGLSRSGVDVLHSCPDLDEPGLHPRSTPANPTLSPWRASVTHILQEF